MFRDVLVLLFPSILYASYYPFMQLALHSQLGKIHMGVYIFANPKVNFLISFPHDHIHDICTCFIGGISWVVLCIGCKHNANTNSNKSRKNPIQYWYRKAIMSVYVSPCYDPAPIPPPPPRLREMGHSLYMCIYFYSGTLKFSSRADAFGNPQSQVQGFIVRIVCGMSSDRYGPGDKWEKTTIWPAGAMWQRY